MHRGAARKEKIEDDEDIFSMRFMIMMMIHENDEK